MKKKLLLISMIALGFWFVGCGGDKNDAPKGFMSNLGDCNVVYQKCMAEAQGTQKERSDRCEKARGMCGAMRTKGCMQECVKQFGRDSSSTETCKTNCQQRRY